MPVTHEELVDAVKNVLLDRVRNAQRAYVTAYQIFTLFNSELQKRLLAEGPFGGEGHGNEERAATVRITHAARYVPNVEVAYLDTCHLQFIDIPGLPEDQPNIRPSVATCGLYRL